MSLSLMVTSDDLPELELELPLNFRRSKLLVLYCLGLTKNLKWCLLAGVEVSIMDSSSSREGK